MCGGVYEEELNDSDLTPGKEQDTKMGDLKFTTALDFMKEQEDDIFYYPGSDCQE